MPTLRESPTTSSIGQGQANALGVYSGSSTDAGIQIVEQFGEALPIGASQTAPLPQTAQSQETPIPTGAFVQPPLKVPSPGNSPRLRTLQLWEGTVTELREDGFVAVLSDKTNPQNPDERGVFAFDRIEISEEDQELISPGASFYWVIGTQVTRGKTVQNVSMVHFRRMPAWTESALARSAARAEGMLRENT